MVLWIAWICSKYQIYHLNLPLPMLHSVGPHSCLPWRLISLNCCIICSPHPSNTLLPRSLVAPLWQNSTVVELYIISLILIQKFQKKKKKKKRNSCKNVNIYNMKFESSSILYKKIRWPGNSYRPYFEIQRSAVNNISRRSESVAQISGTKCVFNLYANGGTSIVRLWEQSSKINIVVSSLFNI